MKKFLSLVLALIMTMSLVTISAGATEYKDLTDKDEIQYEEAVAVLNRIGVITGYEDGSFRPETELTRGAAAKIIVSLMIGPDAASALPNNASPYPDVPAGHTFAGVIGYCKTAGYISGYGDGTFKPANPLTGYAFAKMLLGAVGYKSNIEGFVDTGWTMNVARIGNVAGLFDRLDFDGAKAVTRDEACQLALNTLKATMVDYGNSNTVVSSNGQVLTVQGSKAQYVTSNNRDINANINRRVISATNNELTLEFGEEHFKDLRLKHDRFDPAYDVYGHPSNEWSYKKVTIGTFKLAADFTFTKQISHIEDTAATKEKALGLRGYDTYSTDHRVSYSSWSTPGTNQYNTGSPFADATQIHINGWNARVYNKAYTQGAPSGLKDGQIYTYNAKNDIASNGSNKNIAPSLSEIADLTDNGVTVEVYVCPVDADFITDVVVTRTVLMEVDRVASDFVELDKYAPDSDDKLLTEIAGYNDFALHVDVSSVKDNNYDAYNVLKELKSGDKVAVIPYTTDDGKTGSWEVGRAYVPETVSGLLTNVDIYNTKSWAEGNAVGITVGGTTYPIAQWNKDMIDIDGYKIKASKKDVTLLLDEMGNALLAKDVAASDAWIIVGDYYQAAGTNGRVGWFVHGYTIKGDEVDLELGTIRGAAEKYAPGELVRYKVAQAGNGEYELDKPNYNERAIWKNGFEANWDEPQLGEKDKGTGEGVYAISQYAWQDNTSKEYKIQSRNTLLPLEFYNTEKDKTAKYTVVEDDRYDYSQATALKDVTKSGEEVKLTAGSDAVTDGFYDKKDDYGVSSAAGTDSYNHWFYKTAPYDGVKFIYVDFDSTNGEVETINVLDGVQNVEYKELLHINRWWKNMGTNALNDFVASPAEAYVDKNGKVKAVVIKSDSAEANLKDLMVITDNKGTNTSLSNQKATIGAEAPTSGTYYTRQYVSGEDGFKEEKTGYFDAKLDVGTVITGRLQSNGIIKSRIFHAKEYIDRNPDGMYVKGIGPLTTLEGKDSSTEFYVGALAKDENGLFIEKLEVTTLGTGVEGTKIGLTDENCEIMTGKDVLGVNDKTEKKGLIRIDSTTQFIDLRDGRPGDIDELSDLFDLKNNAEIELKLLVNGNSNSDGFRHAYAIMILEAKGAKDSAAKPVVTINASKNVFPNTVAVTATQVGNVVTINSEDAGQVINLNAVVTNESSCPNLTYLWKDGATGIGTGATVTGVTVPNAGVTKTLTLTVTNRDTSKKDVWENSTVITVNITGKDGGAPLPGTETVTLTLKGLMADAVTANAYKVYQAPQGGEFTLVNPTGGKVTTLVGNPPAEVDAYNYKIQKGYKVYITGDSDAAWDDGAANGTYVVNGVPVIVDAAATSTADKFNIAALNKDLTLWCATQKTFDGGVATAPTKQYALTSHDGVTGTFTLTSDSTKTQKLTAGGTIYIDGAGTFVIDETGTGNHVFASTANKFDSVANSKAKGETLNISGANTDLYSANKVTGDGTLTATAGTQVFNNATPMYVAVNTEITVGNASSFDGVIKSEAAVKTGEAMSGTKFTMTDNKDVVLTGGVKVILEGVTATVDGAAVTSDKTLVKTGETIALSVADSNKVVVDKTAAGSDVYGKAITSVAAAKGKTYAAWTKVDISALDDAATVQGVDGLNNPIGGAGVAKSSLASSVGVLPSFSIVVEGLNTNNTYINVDGGHAMGSVGSTGATIKAVAMGDGSGTKASTTLTVGNTALTLTQGA